MDLRVDRRCRTRLMLKLISINSPELVHMLERDLQSPERECTLERLMRFLLDCLDNDITVDARNWHAGIVDIMILFFKAITDPARSSPLQQVMQHSIVPIHLEAISRLFEEYLDVSSDQKRLQLLLCLRQIRMAYPSWSGESSGRRPSDAQWHPGSPSTRY